MTPLPTPQRLPPQDLDAEQGILGGILQDNAALAKAMELITEADFYRPAHQKLFAGMLTLTERGDVIDAITLTDHLKVRGELESIGGAAYLAELGQAIPTAANIKHHCRLVRDKARLRSLLETSTEMITRGYEEDSPVDDLLDQAERSILGLMEGKTTKSFARMREVIKESHEHIDELAKRGNHHVTGIPTGFAELDDSGTLRSAFSRFY